jgi:hypothetical protein
MSEGHRRVPARAAPKPGGGSSPARSRTTVRSRVIRSSGDDPGKHETFLHETRAGRWLISTSIVVIVGAMALSATPDSELADVVRPLREPITDATGLFQNWNLFAPEPRPTTFRLEARLTYEDGSSATWSPPAGNRFFGAYRSFRWRKWANNVLDRDREDLLRQAAEFIAGTTRRNGRYPVEVVLVKLTYSAPPPGSGRPRDPDPDWSVEPYYTLALSETGDVIDGSVHDEDGAR